MKQHGAKTGIQLAHAGRKATVDGDIYAPSAIAFNDKYKKPVEMTIDDIKETVQAFKDGAIRAKKAGFDVIELHGAHGYLINEFLSPLSNKRTDAYGGSGKTVIASCVKLSMRCVRFGKVPSLSAFPHMITRMVA